MLLPHDPLEKNGGEFPTPSRLNPDLSISSSTTIIIAGDKEKSIDSTDMANDCTTDTINVTINDIKIDYR